MVAPPGFSAGEFIAATLVATEVLDLLGALANEANQDSVIILSFRSLQAQRIKELQQELYQISLYKNQSLNLPGPTTAVDINSNLDRLLHNYAEAIRNYETLSQEALEPNSLKRDSRARSIIRHIFRLPKPQYDSLSEKILKDRNLGFNLRELNKDIREAKMRNQVFSERIWMGALGGVAVIGPMLLMSRHRTLTTSLVTSSLATVLFTLVLALGARNLQGHEVLGAVAAYAAVLVVFVGTSIPPVS